MSDELLWYVSRATGVVSLVLLTGVLCLGMITAGRRSPRGSGATVVMALHRWVSLGMVVFLAAHIVTAIVDGYVSIGWLAVVVPFVSDYEPLLIGLGALAVDLLAAVMLTSLLRHRLPERSWRLVHWLSYAMWPIAVVHGFALGTDDQPMLRIITVACAAAGAAAVLWRSVNSHADRDRRRAINTGEWA